jgi:hypothetical protein
VSHQSEKPDPVIPLQSINLSGDFVREGDGRRG